MLSSEKTLAPTSTLMNKPTVTAQRGRFGRLRRLLLSDYFVLYLTIIMYVTAAIILPRLGRPNTLALPGNIANQFTNIWPLLAVAIGQTFVLIVVSNTFFSYGESMTAAFLPELAKPEGMGKVSGWGWSFGYFGGMLALGICLGYVIWAGGRGIKADSFVPVTMLITAVIYGAAALVTFKLLKERAVPNPAAMGQSGMKASLVQLKKTFHEARRYPDFMWLLLCAVFYQGGVAVAITLAAIYAEQVIGFVQQETMVLIFVLNFAAAAGAFGLGYLQDRIGHKRALGLTLIGWALTCIIAALTTSKGMFWYAAALAGFCMGSSQSAGRAMAGLLAPPKQVAEFFGLWTFATRLASIIGPLSYGAITWATGGNQRISIASTTVLFVAGFLVLQRIDMARGRRVATEAG